MNLNPNCCGSHCASQTGECRVLPLGRIPLHGSLTLCRACYEHEMNWRKERNRQLSEENQFALPEWIDLAVHGSGECPQCLRLKRGLLDIDERLSEANRRLWEAHALLLDHVQNPSGAPDGRGYVLCLTEEQTRRMWQLLSGDDDTTLAEPA